MISMWEDAKKYDADEVYPSGVGPGDATLLFAAHTAEDSFQSSLRNVSVSRAQLLILL